MLCIFFTIFQSIINGYDSLVQMSSSLCAAWCHLFVALSEKSCLPLGISAINSSNFHFLNLSIFLIYCILVQPTKLKVVVARCDNVNFFSVEPPHLHPTDFMMENPDMTTPTAPLTLRIIMQGKVSSSWHIRHGIFANRENHAKLCCLPTTAVAVMLVTGSNPQSHVGPPSF